MSTNRFIEEADKTFEQVDRSLNQLVSDFERLNGLLEKLGFPVWETSLADQFDALFDDSDRLVHSDATLEKLRTLKTLINQGGDVTEYARNLISDVYSLAQEAQETLDDIDHFVTEFTSDIQASLDEFED